MLQSIAAVLGAVPGLDWVTFPLVEFAANVALFAPVGALLVAWRRPSADPRSTGLAIVAGAVLGLAVSGVIETVQLALPERVSDGRDLIANTLGAAAGAVLAAMVRRRVRASRSA